VTDTLVTPGYDVVAEQARTFWGGLLVLVGLFAAFWCLAVANEEAQKEKRDR
jgi:hypothetical protein